MSLERCQWNRNSLMLRPQQGKEERRPFKLQIITQRKMISTSRMKISLWLPNLACLRFNSQIMLINLWNQTARTVVLKLLGRNTGVHALANKTYAIWKPSRPFTLMDLENGYFLARFQNDEDYEKVLAEGPWIIYGQYLTVQPWTMDFRTSQQYRTNMIVWIRFPGLPEYMYKRKILYEIGNLVGKVAKLDFHSATSNKMRFSRITVYVDLKKPLMSLVVVGNKIQVVEYENLPLVCFSCGRFVLVVMQNY
ncbi:hypothetical protein F3Y22_tig00110462pilonHSYRG00168 [Hibiscus syriacus]|uniref:DUF4283 domain-containing protein n=1 Tax=Hibiscus syriacus TaxID=106335 RepID=A0A6A3AKN6_HIBSY|nr:hypothetical protein F3Y22_tig00110462pilonHSYRG00168 [Hibiscus syriacus]